MMKEKILEKKDNQTAEIVPNDKKNSKKISSEKYTVFCVDDDAMTRAMLKNTLKRNDHLHVQLFEDGESLIEVLDQQPDIIILDFYLTTFQYDEFLLNGLEILEKIKEKSPNTSVIMLSSQDEISVAVQCLKKGAKDYIIKDSTMDINLNKSIDSLVKSIELRKEISALSQKIKRDKLLIKGYFIIILLLICGVTYLVLR